MAADHTVPPSLVTAFRDRYELVRETGRGGSATVFLARDLKHDRFVALKVLNPDVGQTTGERFLREIQVSAGMQHPHILPTYDSGVADGRLYFVMPFVDGGSLRQRLDAATALEVETALRIAHDIAVALAHAHDLGVIHRDVKPENILFYHGLACLADFGVARAIEQMDATITAHGTIVGTPAYMSPEQVTAEGFDGRSDVYSLACVLYEMIAGARLFAGATAREVLLERARRPSLMKIRPSIPTYVDHMLTQALATLPDDRFSDARSFAKAIEDCLAQMKEPPERISAPKRALAAMRRRKWSYAAAAGGVILLGGIASAPVREEVALRFMSDVAPPARRAFRQGLSAMSSWDMPAAERAFTVAAAADTLSPQPRLWQAEAMALGRRTQTGEFRVATMRLASIGQRLTGRDSLLAAGLIALGAGKFTLACDAYNARLAQDSLDVLAWYGLGDCHALDTTVVQDRGSPSGWRFNSSWEAASRAYIRAVTLEPNAHAALPYSAMTLLLPTDPAYVRRGGATVPTRQSFFAYPALVGDSIAWVPYPQGTARFIQAPVPPSRNDALRRNRQVLLTFAEQWTSAAPSSPEAFEALSLAREGRGEVDDGPNGAVAPLERARSLARAPLIQVRLAGTAARLNVKRSRFAEARAIADSILAAWNGQTAEPAVAGYLSGLAALTGRIDLSTRYMTAFLAPRNAGTGVTPTLTEAANTYFMRAAYGVCDDSLAAIRQNFERMLDSYAEPTRREQLRWFAIGRAAPLAFSCSRAAAYQGLPPSSPIDRALLAFARGATAQARRIVDTIRLGRASRRPGDVALDNTFQLAWLHAALRDTALAEQQLDLVLAALPTLGTFIAREEAQSAAVGRVMAFRAELAAARRDTVTARKWAANALALWSSADAPLRPTLTRLRSLSGQ